MLLFFALLACNETKKSKELTTEEQLKEYKKDLINFQIGDSPKEFSAKTTDGKLFKSADYKGKFWVIFVYDRSYLIKSETYDMVAELNQTHKKYGDKIPMLGLIKGYSDNGPQLKQQIDNAKMEFSLIDNTQGPNKETKAVKDDVFCTPAKILIDPNGKVLYNFCGGKTETFDIKLDSLVKANKW